MADVTGSYLFAKALKNEGVDSVFYLMGGPISPIVGEAEKMGIKAYYVRHEQAATFAAHAYARVTGKTGVAITTAGPGTANAITGISNAQADGAPVLLIGGSSNINTFLQDSFQEMDQLPMFKSISKLAFKAELTARVPEYMSVAFRHAQEGCKGAVYIDAPGDVINGKVDEAKVWWPTQYRVESRPQGDPAQIRKAVEMLAKAEKPIIVSGSGVLWSEGWDEYKQFVEQTGIPFYTTPQGRGAISDEHPMMFAGGRTLGFREADVVLVLATRANSMLTNFRAPRWNANAKFIEINIDGKELGHNRAVDLGIIADAKQALKQLIEESKGKIKPERYEKWRETLKKQDEVRAEKAQTIMNSTKVPVHPARLCKELTEAMPRDAYLVVDGHEIMGFSRQTMPILKPRHIINAGPMGCMGVGVPFGLGVQAAHPDKPVVVLCGDGAFGWNGMEVDTAIRHKLPIKIIISNNAGFTGRGTYGMTGRELGWQRYDKMMEAFGGYGEWVEDPEKIRPAIERALKHDGPALVNVKTDPEARASSAVGF